MATRRDRHKAAIATTLKERSPAVRALHSSARKVEQAAEQIAEQAALTWNGYQRKDIEPNPALTPAECEQIGSIQDRLRELVYEINGLAAQVRYNEPASRKLHADH